jgi:hypothetical protein
MFVLWWRTTTSGLKNERSPEYRKRGVMAEIRVIGLILLSFNTYTDSFFNTLVSYLPFARVIDDLL